MPPRSSMRPICRFPRTWSTVWRTSRPVLRRRRGLRWRLGWRGGRRRGAPGKADRPIYGLGSAAERSKAAAEAAHNGSIHLVLTARAENHLRGRPDLRDTIRRLQAYQEAGSDVLYAPGLSDLDEIAQVVTSVDRPVNVLAGPGVPTVPELAAIGVSRLSGGGAFAYAALGALIEAAQELRTTGTYTFWDRARTGVEGARAAFTD